MCGVWLILLPLPITGSLHTKLVAICGFRLFIRKLYKYFSLRILSAGSPLLNHENIDGLLSRVLLVVPEYVDNRGGCRRKSHEKGAANDLLPVTSCVLHTAHICIPNTDYVPLMCYMFIPVTTVYAGFPCILSISAHHAGGGGRNTMCFYGGICSVKIHVCVRENRCLHLLLTGLSLTPPVLGNICQGLPALVAW